ncbi:uncharacterized protein LOC116612005 [Nematostella vectensis]|uniref:uncharacterized protein LOC116612005 n=1 Tax=Nematostella vectensis TaxID=45351 RepID=UPI0020776A48|nr:uncharacterized protein LOC116612005 [Nematostella vectensis]
MVKWMEEQERHSPWNELEEDLDSDWSVDSDEVVVERSSIYVPDYLQTDRSVNNAPRLLLRALDWVLPAPQRTPSSDHSLPDLPPHYHTWDMRYYEMVVEPDSRVMRSPYY